MANLGKIFAFYTILQLITISGAYATITTPQISQEPVDLWFQNSNRLVEKTIKLQFYDRVVFSGPGQNAYEVARASITSTSPTSFGLVQVADADLTIGQEPSSPQVGRAQGLIAFSDLQQAAYYLSLNFVFTTGPYNGSTIAISGRATLVNETRELSIVGGTGVFRLARGIVTTTPFSPLNATVSIFRYDLYIIYPG